METPSTSTSSYQRDDGPVRATLVGIGLTVFGLLMANVLTTPAFLFDPALLEGLGNGSIAGRTLALILNFVGMFLAGLLYLLATGRGVAWIDLRIPSRRDWKYIVAGGVGSLLFLFAFNIVSTLLEVSAADSQIMEIIGGDQTMILIMIAIVFLFNAPAEEFLFRNVIQKRLYAAFTRMQAVVVASVIFALVHFPMYVAFADSLLSTLASLTVMFGGALIFGYVYAKTDNLLVPTAAHAVLNAFQFGVLYLAIEYGIEEVQAEPSTLAEVVDVAWTVATAVA
ncbi:CAAX protease family protein [Halobiforma lacisalsi AJ5]|uniref:Abortive infection protein n=1 Tax=Natronobacterium lacisalsi AJ5 TaxID=358396 RepID=M0LNK0_NATLA|nr:CPBP family glutamic-type intramembrane protease [Halobiforma lacisalsi]APW97195.1 CAAX protease family protein [Halobiforma lacisalsi AJ5]EMA34029.1 abortive infection protein [Halobiforma lacisalsi AJ5]